MGIEPTPTAWKAVVLAVILHPHCFELSISPKILTQRIPYVKAYFARLARVLRKISVVMGKILCYDTLAVFWKELWNFFRPLPSKQQIFTKGVILWYFPALPSSTHFCP